MQQVETTVETTVERQDIDNDDDVGLSHVVCTNCYPDDSPSIALCGTDVSDDEWGSEDDTDCVVCLDLERFPCSTCGG